FSAMRCRACWTASSSASATVGCGRVLETVSRITTLLPAGGAAEAAGGGAVVMTAGFFASVGFSTFSLLVVGLLRARSEWSTGGRQPAARTSIAPHSTRGRNRGLVESRFMGFTAFVGVPPLGGSELRHRLKAELQHKSRLPHPVPLRRR